MKQASQNLKGFRGIRMALTAALVNLAIVLFYVSPVYAQFSGAGNSAVVYVLAKADLDSDSDGLSDAVEAQLGTNPLSTDSDSDGIDDSWEVANGLNPLDPMDAGEDSDDDGLSNLQEYAANSSPFNVDTDGDGFSDAVEVARGADPASAASYPVPSMKSDVNCDGVVNAIDVQMVINGALGLPVPVPVNVNHVGGVNALDVQIVINDAVGH